MVGVDARAQRRLVGRRIAVGPISTLKTGHTTRLRPLTLVHGRQFPAAACSRAVLCLLLGPCCLCDGSQLLWGPLDQPQGLKGPRSCKVAVNRPWKVRAVTRVVGGQPALLAPLPSPKTTIPPLCSGLAQACAARRSTYGGLVGRGVAAPGRMVGSRPPLARGKEPRAPPSTVAGQGAGQAREGPQPRGLEAEQRRSEQP